MMTSRSYQHDRLVNGLELDPKALRIQDCQHIMNIKTGYDYSFGIHILLKSVL